MRYKELLVELKAEEDKMEKEIKQYLKYHKINAITDVEVKLFKNEVRFIMRKSKYDWDILKYEIGSMSFRFDEIDLPKSILRKVIDVIDEFIEVERRV